MIGDVFLDIVLAVVIGLGIVMIPVGFFALGVLYGKKRVDRLISWGQSQVTGIEPGKPDKQ